MSDQRRACYGRSGGFASVVVGVVEGGRPAVRAGLGNLVEKHWFGWMDFGARLVSHQRQHGIGSSSVHWLVYFRIRADGKVGLAVVCINNTEVVFGGQRRWQVRGGLRRVAEVDLITTITKLSSLGQQINYEAYTYPVKKVDFSKLKL
ncbi:hypothetical protein M0R45_027464 [Rubus argutus]|uniref:Uncharacterized protein n=1 Tax=Rubus argutus TaxID=59490 RepID=A0AAW1X0G9_RUBAR